MRQSQVVEPAPLRIALERLAASLVYRVIRHLEGNAIDDDATQLISVNGDAFPKTGCPEQNRIGCRFKPLYQPLPWHITLFLRGKCQLVVKHIVHRIQCGFARE